MRASCEGRPEGPDSGPGPSHFVRRPLVGAAVAAMPDAAFAAEAGLGPDAHLSTVLGGFVFVGALILVFMRLRRSRRGRGGDSGVVGAIDHILDGDDDSDGGGNGGNGGGGD